MSAHASVTSGSVPPSDGSAKRLASAIRFLAVDAILNAGEGQGVPLGMAEIATALFTRHLKFNPKDPLWPDRDRFVVSNGHGSMLLYALLHLTGYEKISLAQVTSADIVITNKAPIRLAELMSASKLRLIAIAATGSDVVDVKACANRGVAVSNIRGYAVNTVPEHTFALILALRRSLTAYRDSVRAGRWAESGQFCYFDYPINDLSRATFGIIGDGALGRAVADIGRAFGMRTLFSSYKGVPGMGPLYTPFEDVLRQSDIITLHAPLMPQTRNMIAAPEFALMERRPILINTARGDLVDEVALGQALRSGQLAGAGFDVATVEPPQADHPLMQLVGLPNFILTPHVAWASREAVPSLANQLVDNVEGFWNGMPRNIVAEAL